MSRFLWFTVYNTSRCTQYIKMYTIHQGVYNTSSPGPTQRLLEEELYT